MSEQLLTASETAARLVISKRTFCRHRPLLVARGLKMVNLGRHPKYVASSVDDLIDRLAETEEHVSIN